MFTNNYIAFRKKVFEAISYSEYASLKDISGTSRNAYIYRGGYADMGACMKYPKCAAIAESEKIASSFSGGIYFGSGSTPAAKTDYCLESPITSGLTISATYLVYQNDGDGKYTVSMDYVVRNASGSEISISEIGAVSFMPSSYNSNNTYNVNVVSYPFLWERTVLDEPITIPAGESKLVTYKLTFN